MIESTQKNVEHQTLFNCDPHFVRFINTNHFYAEMWRYVKPILTTKIPTACVRFDLDQEHFLLELNPDFLNLLSDAQIQGLLQHEILHIVWDHLSTIQHRKPRNIWNIAEDLSINSSIKSMVSQDTQKKIELPPAGYVPGERGMVFNDISNTFHVIPEEELLNYPLLTLIERLPKNLTSHEYYVFLRDSGLFDDVDPSDYAMLSRGNDIHDWDSVDHTKVSEHTRRIVEKAMNVADSMNGWGSIPSHIQRAIRNFVNRTVDWRRYLEYFVGTCRSIEHTSTLKRINRRFPYIHAGTKRSMQARLLIAIDASGSVNDKMLELLFASLRSLNEFVEIDVIQFDCELDASKIRTWAMNENPPVIRERSGGTDFNAPTNLVNDQKYEGRWDGLLICTDGQAPRPNDCKIRRAWVIPENCNLHFETDEIVIKTSYENLQ